MPVEMYEGLESELPGICFEYIDGGHFYVEENPKETLAKALPFLTS